MDMTPEQLALITPSAAELFQSCTINGRQCDMKKLVQNLPYSFSCSAIYNFSDFKTRLDPTFGYCHTFHHQRTPKYYIERSGDYHGEYLFGCWLLLTTSLGLRIIVVSNVSEYVLSSQVAGIRLVIHDPHNYAFPASQGFSAGVGSAASYAVRYVSQSIHCPSSQCSSRNICFTARGTKTGRTI